MLCHSILIVSILFKLCLTLNSPNANIIFPNHENFNGNLNLNVSFLAKEPLRKFLFVALKDSQDELKNESSNIQNLNQETFIFSNPIIINGNESKKGRENKADDISSIKYTIVEVLSKIKNSLYFSDNELGKRCILVLMLVILTIVMCCLALQIIISMTKNCKLALNEISARERKLGMINQNLE